MSEEYIRKILGRILNSIDDYNKYRVPEVRAEFVRFEGNYFIVRFTGSICFSCGFYDYFEDLKYLLMNYSIFTNIVEVITSEIGDETVVKYEVVGCQSIT